jgi:hypothetical protein
VLLGASDRGQMPTLPIPQETRADQISRNTKITRCPSRKAVHSFILADALPYPKSGALDQAREAGVGLESLTRCVGGERNALEAHGRDVI